jgi:hypothetical protein
MKIRNIAIFAAAVFAGAIAGSLVGPRPAEAVAREIIDLQRDVTTLLQGQKDISTPPWAQSRSLFKTCKPTLAPAWTPCPRKSRVSLTIWKKLNRASANSISSSSTFKAPCNPSTPKSPAPPRPAPLPAQILGRRMTALPLPQLQATQVPPRLALPPLPLPTCFIPTACATSPAANTISLARNFSTISSITAKPTSPPTPNSISAKSPTLRSNIRMPFRSTTKCSPSIRKASSWPPRTSRRAWL